MTSVYRCLASLLLYFYDLKPLPGPKDSLLLLTIQEAVSGELREATARSPCLVYFLIRKPLPRWIYLGFSRKPKRLLAWQHATHFENLMLKVNVLGFCYQGRPGNLCFYPLLYSTPHSRGARDSKNSLLPVRAVFMSCLRKVVFGQQISIFGHISI